MNKTVKTDRIVVLSVLMLIILCVYFVFLYKLQIVEGEAYAEKSANSIASTQIATAARGNILDRYGRVLVSNSPSYNIVINEHQLFYEQDDPNAAILKITSFVTDHGGKYTDTLPITASPPFEYTEMTSSQQTALKAYLKDKKMDESTSAVELMSYMRTRYKIDNNYSAEQTRVIAGIRYELNVRYADGAGLSSYLFVANADKELITAMLENDLPAVSVTTSYVRTYSTKYAAHLLGNTGVMTAEDYDTYKSKGYSMNAIVGRSGAEKAFESYLHGTDGVATITTTADGTVTDTTYSTEPVPGDNVYTTIDLSLQEAAEDALSTGVEALRKSSEEEAAKKGVTISDENNNRITGGAVAVVDVNTGEPLALASYPTYDLTNISDYDYYSELVKDKDSPLYNRATMGTYAPGSTFKPCTAIAALSEGIINTGTTIRCDGVFKKYAAQNYTPVCWIWSKYHMVHGSENVTTAIRDSCNIFFYTLGDELQIDKLDKYAYDFGLGKATGIELDENTGIMASKEYKKKTYGEDWYNGDNVQAGIGQSYMLFTPLQMAEYCATVANGGQRHTASMLKMVRSYDYSQTIFQREAEVLSTVESSDANWKAVQYGMYLVANDPTGSAYSSFGHYKVKVAAKTGTAQTGAGSANNGMFICYAPYDDPKIAIAVSVEHAGAGASLGSIAKDIMDAYFNGQSTQDSTENELVVLK